MAVDETFRQRLQQFRIGRRVGFAHVVFRIHQTAIEEMFPVTVDQRPGKKWIIRVRHPIRQRLARIIIL